MFSQFLQVYFKRDTNTPKDVAVTPQFKGLFTPDAKTLEPNSMHIEYVLVTFTLCIHNSVWSDANSMLIQPNPPLEMDWSRIGT